MARLFERLRPPRAVGTLEGGNGAPAPEVRIVSDQPAANPALGFKEYADALADAIRGGGPGRFTVGLYGPWGSGKSTLLAAIRSRLAEDRDVVVADFDAWRYAGSDHIIVPLLHSVHQAAHEAGLHDLERTLTRALESLVFSLNFRVAGVGVDTKNIRSTWREGGLPALDTAFAAPFAALRKIPGTLGDRRIVVLIDDLDRCSPSSVVAILEAVNVVMDVERFVFVLALDFDVLTAAIREQFKHVGEPHVFVEKMVQIPFRVPPIDIDRPEFLEELVPDWKDHFEALPDVVGERLVEMARLGLERNPRQLKRLLNSFGVVRRIMQLKKLDVHDEVLLAVLALQLRWPEEYRAFQEEVLGGDDDPLGALRTDSTDPELDQFRSRFLDGVAETDKLRAVVGLAAAVTAAPSVEPDPFEAATTKSAQQRNLDITVTAAEIEASYGDLKAKGRHALPVLPPSDVPAGTYGPLLLDAMPDDVKQVVERAVADAQLSAADRVTIALRLGPEPPLHDVWWETLPEGGGRGVAWSKRTPFSRRLLEDEPVRRLGPADPPLRLLVAGWDAEELALDGTVERRLVLPQELSIEALHVEAERMQPHVVHLHASWQTLTDTGVEVGRDVVPPERLIELLRELDSLRLVVLTAPSGSAHVGPLARVGAFLRQGIPAVLAVRQPLADPEMRRLVRGLLGALVQGRRLDEAVNEARSELRFASDEESWSWAAPALYLGRALAHDQGIVTPPAGPELLS